MSEASSGEVRSSAIRTDSTTWRTGSISASRISSSVISIVFGTPATRSRPLISMVWISLPGYADPIVILISSAVRSVVEGLYLCALAVKALLDGLESLRRGLHMLDALMCVADQNHKRCHNSPPPKRNLL